MSNRLYVGNLSFDVTEQVLRQTFTKCGEVVEAKLVLDRESGRSRGFGFVEMSSAEAARSAIEALDGSDLSGRSLRVSEAQERGSRPSGGGGGGGGREFNRGY